MKGDFSRNTFDPRNHFTRVLMQQGRVQLDADWNEQVAILLHYQRTLAADLIGPHGGPLGSFGFGIVDPSTLSEEEKTSVESLGLLPLESGDFLIGKGHYYVDGILCENENFSLYSMQPHLATEKLQPGWYIVYLDVWERHITHIVDERIREVALGGPDTATRAKVVWQVKTWKVDTDTNCEDIRKGWGGLVENWQPENRGKLKAMAKVPEPTATTDPCIIPPQARYRGAENQLYRVEIHTGGTTAQKATFKWSRDNGSIVFPIVSSAANTVTVEHLGRDSRRSVKEGDWVEIVDDDYVLRGLPGPLLQVDAVDPMDMVITLRLPEGIHLPVYEEESEKHPLLRRWDHKAGDPTQGEPEMADDGGLGVKENEWITLEDGVQVFFENEGKHHYRTGDHWLIPARTATGDVEWPVDSAGAAKSMAPHGITHHYAPLAIGEVVKNELKMKYDCRRKFEWLPEISS